MVASSVWHRLIRDTAGNIGMLTALLAAPLCLATGGAVEFATYETMRSRAQQALDRGVLAAASLGQTADAEKTIRDHLDKAIGPGEYTLQKPRVERSLNSSKVEAVVNMKLKTSFLGLAGIYSLNVQAESSAEETRPNIEISLILDVSGSMIDNGGLAQLKPAAKQFIDDVLTDDMRPVTSVTLIPFAGGVNIGKISYDYFAGGAGRRTHNYSSCFEFEDVDYSGSVPPFFARKQMPHFTYYNHNAQPKEPWWCPSDAASVSYLSNDPVALKAKIDSLKAYDGTGTQYAVKWASILLDPAVRPGIAAAAAIGLVPSKFADRPANYHSETTQKYIIVMTDGQISDQFRPPAARQPYDYSPNNQNKNYSKLVTSGQAGSQYDKACDVAKANGVMIFTLAFKISNNGVANSIAKCASSKGHAYRADGLDIKDAFESIASELRRLRLIG